MGIDRPAVSAGESMIAHNLTWIKPVGRLWSAQVPDRAVFQSVKIIRNGAVSGGGAEQEE
jgi:hypothetical protein